MRLFPVLLISAMLAGCAAKQAIAPPPQPAPTGVQQYQGPPPGEEAKPTAPPKAAEEDGVTFQFSLPKGWFPTGHGAPGVPNSMVFISPFMKGMMIFMVQQTSEGTPKATCDEFAKQSRKDGNKVKPVKVSADGKTASFSWTGKEKAGKVMVKVVEGKPELTYGVIGFWPPQMTKLAEPDFDSFANGIKLQTE